MLTLLEAAHSVVVIPGYGMAVAQAQHAVRELGELLAANGTEDRYAIRPQMDTIDVAMVIGATDTVNPAAEEDPNGPRAGMPIIQAHRARTEFALKRSMRSGFAGVENLLFFTDNTWIIFGDAKATNEGLAGELRRREAVAKDQ